MPAHTAISVKYFFILNRINPRACLYFPTFAFEMTAIRNTPFIRNFFLLIVLFSHICLVFFYFRLIEPEFKTNGDYTGNYYFVSSNDISTWINNTSNEKTLQVHLLTGITLLGYLSLFHRIVPFLRLNSIFICIVKVFRLSPTYIIHRVLII